MAKKGPAAHAATSGPSQGQHSENTLQLPPSQSSLSVRSEYNDSSTGYITASSSRASQLDSEPTTSLPRINLESMQSSTPVKRSSLAKSPSTDSTTTTTGDSSSNETSRAQLASLSSVTTFIPSTLDALDTSDEDDNALSDPDKRDDMYTNDTDEFVPNYDFDLRDPHERTINRESDDQGANDTADHDQTLTVCEAMEGDVITVSHSHSTSINTYNDSSIPHSRSASKSDSSPNHGTSHHHHDHPSSSSSFPLSLSASWPSMPSLALPPSAIKLHRRRRNILLRLLKTWEGREQVLQFSHSLVLILYSSLDHPVPQTYRGAIIRPAGTLLAMSFPRPIRVALMQRIYTTAEGIDNFRRVILIARWVTTATEAAMDYWQHRQDNNRQAKRAAQLPTAREQLEIKLTGDEPIDKQSDHVEQGFAWLQPPSIAPFDADSDKGSGEQSFVKSPAAKLGKLTGRGDATGAVGADVAENDDAEKRGKQRKDANATATATATANSSSSSVVRTFIRLWSSLWRLSHLEAAAESLATVGEACETAAVLAGGGMFWRAVGIQRLGLPFLSRRRRQGVERLGIVLSLCSVLLSLLVLRMERKALRSELRSAHRRIIRANDKLGWASDLAGTSIERDQALSHRKRDPSLSRTSKGNNSSRSEEDKVQLEMLGPDLQAAARELDDQELNEDVNESCSSSLSSSDDSTLSDTWTVVPDGDDRHPHPTSRPIHSTHHYHHHHYRPHRHLHHDDYSQKHTYSHGDDKVKPIDVSSLVRSTERSLVRAESDLRKTRRRIKLNFCEKVANWSESIFLSYEAAMPHIDKDGIEGWTGLVASAIRLSGLWKELSWN
ncbi:uncharacterized protein UTRI_03493 [Ustilago trichophora]|uniref:Uncharacterized protein n=1 Tax=Ustilago trichophora TaxID=86804 RepID=A0A5C3E1W8_9BASI|nr:uncharacterized protein UTRI_03493 [Ustilago trichophora]